tara:strand:- start:671 stop:955 length:285 start_codon:yes stop_codon:yes gene_type:complete
MIDLLRLRPALDLNLGRIRKMGISKEQLNPERTEKIISDLLQQLPEKVSLSDSRNLVCELLFGLGLNPNDLPIFLIMVVDSYMGERRVDWIKEG